MKINDHEVHEPGARSDLLPVVGIGASAGGLAALKQFVQHTPADTGLAFVVVVHLSPTHESHLDGLLQRHTRMPVIQVTETVRMKRNHVYLIPPGANLTASDDHLHLSELEEERGRRAPIDHFFDSLAVTHRRKAIGVVLTGANSDGTLGLRRIHEEGGLTIAQDPVEAQYHWMPQSAISSGVVDQVLPISEMPDQMIRFARAEPNLPEPVEERARGSTRPKRFGTSSSRQPGPPSRLSFWAPWGNADRSKVSGRTPPRTP